MSHSLPAAEKPEPGRVLIGTAGWALPKAEQHRFPEGASHLERYAALFAAVEINSSFHRSHRRTTWERWRESVPERFRFCAKVPKAITHTARLAGVAAQIDAFLEEAGGLQEKLTCLLVQLPPSLVYDASVAESFFAHLRQCTAIAVVCEPRHESWFTAEADALLQQFLVSRVAADPARVPAAATPGGWRGLSYFRLHGSPRMYYSAYSPEFIANLARQIALEREHREVWCIFDNTTLGAATSNALDLADLLARG